MFSVERSWAVVLAAAAGLVCLGCQQKTSPKPAEKNPAAAHSEKQASQPETTKPAAETTPVAKPESPPSTKDSTASAALAKMPKVALSDALRASCLVNVGDALPAAALPDASGKMLDLKSLYGPKLTVVCFWTIGTTHRSQLTAEAVLQDLAKQVAEPFGAKGVQIVGIDVGDSPDAVDANVQKAGASFPNLSDADGAYFAKIARDKRMPRIFLLDAAGRILWFDVEFGRASRFDLTQAIRAGLGEL